MKLQQKYTERFWRGYPSEDEGKNRRKKEAITRNDVYNEPDAVEDIYDEFSAKKEILVLRGREEEMPALIDTITEKINEMLRGREDG